MHISFLPTRLSFYPILIENKRLHDALPTHSLQEIKALNKILPDKIKLLIISKDNNVIGGNMIFVANKNMAIIFYNMINHMFSELQISVIQVIESIRWASKNNYKFLDFGISHKPLEKNPLTPKMSLIKFKEQFGAFGSLRFVFNKNIT